MVISSFNGFRRGSFLLALWALGFFAGAIFRCDAAEDPNTGHIGSVLVRDKASGFFVVNYVATGSPADAAGIKQGDLVTALDDEPTPKMTEKELLHFIHGNIGGTLNLAIRREGVPDQTIAVVRKSMTDAYLPAAEAGEARAQFYVGYALEHGSNPGRDSSEAAEWYRKSADQGNMHAQVNLAYLLRYGRGTMKNLEMSAEWYLKAAKQGDIIAERETGENYLYGWGAIQNDHEAFDWFYSAARADDAIAENYLAWLYLMGRGVGRDDVAGYDWYYRSAVRGNYSGEWGLGYMYQTGRGVKKDPAEALKWYRLAQVGYPKDEKLKKQIFSLSLKSFLENPASGALDLTTMTTAFRWELVVLLITFGAVYVNGLIVLLVFSFVVKEGPTHLALAIGWVAFYVESQAVAFVVLCLYGKSLTADSLMVLTMVLSALPVVVSTLGRSRARIWKAPSISVGRILLYSAGACVGIFVMEAGYSLLYTAIMHAPLPDQPTHALISKTRDASQWIAYATIALALPMAEEIMFRCYLFEALRKWLPGYAVVAITAFCFALVHFQALYFVPLMAIGLALGWLRLKTDSLRVPILLHMLNNGLFLAFAT